MSERSGDDVPRDPWGNPLPPEDRAPLNPRPDDYPPPFPSDPPGGAPTSTGDAAPTGVWPPGRPTSPPAPPRAPSEPPPGANPAWPGSQAPSAPPPSHPGPPQAPSAPPQVPDDPAWPGSSPEPGWGGPGGQAPPTGSYGSGPGWGGPGVPTQQGYQPPPQGWGPAPWAPPKNDGMAIGALVCSIVGLLCLGIVLEPVAIALALVSRRRIRESHGTLKGDGMALAALVVGCIGLVLAVVGLIILARNPDALNDFFDRLTTTTVAGDG